MQAWLSDHPLIAYLLILGMTFYIFQNVFRPQKVKLPLLKAVFMYLTMIVGSGILLIMQIDRLPIVQCMAVAIIMMVMLRARQLYDKWKGDSTTAK